MSWFEAFKWFAVYVGGAAIVWGALIDIARRGTNDSEAVRRIEDKLDMLLKKEGLEYGPERKSPEKDGGKPEK